MLLGMYYHEGNGSPFYYKKDYDGIPDVASFIDAVTLKPFINHESEPFKIDFEGMARRSTVRRMFEQEKKVEWLK